MDESYTGGLQCFAEGLVLFYCHGFCQVVTSNECVQCCYLPVFCVEGGKWNANIFLLVPFHRSIIHAHLSTFIMQATFLDG